MKKQTLIFLFLCILGIASTLHAEVRLSHIFSSNMVLQRNETINIWGWANKNESVEVRFKDQVKKTKADKSGYWIISLNPEAHGGPHTLQIKGKENSITLNNILVGEVWLCSGQSNMEMTVNGWAQVYNFEQEIEAANYPQIRTFNVEKTINATPQPDLGGVWEVCSPQTVSNFSATAYFFARKLNKELDIPIGIIHSSWGGTGIETWISNDKFKILPEKFGDRYKSIEYKNMDSFVEENKKNQVAYREALKNDKGISQEWFKQSAITADWKTMQVPQKWLGTELSKVDGIVWFRYNIDLPANVEGKKAHLSLGTIDDNDVSWINGVKLGETTGNNVPRDYDIPAGVLKNGANIITVKVIDNMGGGGIYGSEDNLFLEIDGQKYPLAGEWSFRPSVTNLEYNFIELSPNMLPSLLYNGMINPITKLKIKGAIWYQGESNANAAYNYQTLFPTLIWNWRQKWGYEFPFYWVQLANFMEKDKQPTESEWAELREAQTKTLSLPHTGQAVISDIGDASDIHPRNKQDVGLRLALIALKQDYGKDNIVCSGPTFESMDIAGGKVNIHFDNASDGLVVNNKYGYVEGFAIAGADNKFVWAKAYIEADKVVVYNENIANPVAVRYSWSNNPDVNLYNSSGLPAAPFRTDNLKGITERYTHIK